MSIEIPTEAYPLTWPAGQKRAHLRDFGKFKPRGFGLIRDELLDELRRLGASSVIISSDLRLRQDGLPYADQREPQDPGIAVYFRRGKKPYVIACDQFDKTWKNLRAITGTIEALRAIERYGSTKMMEQAFSGFAALPPAREAEANWWETLGVPPHAALNEIEAAYKALAIKHHPDRGGDAEQMARINRARDAAYQERGR